MTVKWQLSVAYITSEVDHFWFSSEEWSSSAFEAFEAVPLIKETMLIHLQNHTQEISI